MFNLPLETSAPWKFSRVRIFLTFPKSAQKMDPPSPLEIPFLSHTPWKYYHSLWTPKISHFFSARYRILILACFFQKIGGYCDQHITRRYVTYFKDAYRRICNMKIIDLIPSIPLHNFNKTAVTKKIHFQDR